MDWVRFERHLRVYFYELGYPNLNDEIVTIAMILERLHQLKCVGLVAPKKSIPYLEHMPGRFKISAEDRKAIIQSTEKYRVLAYRYGISIGLIARIRKHVYKPWQ